MKEIFKDLDNNEFIDFFYNKLKIKSDIISYLITIMPQKNHRFEDEDLAILIVLSLTCIQKIKSIEVLVKEDMYLSASDQVRGLIEALRLTRLLALDKEYLELYKNNENIDFRTTRDNQFMQNKVIKRLESIYKEIETSEKENGIYTARYEYGNKRLIKGSAMSEQHSTLSKLAHLTNVNMIMPLYLEEKNGEFRINLFESRNRNISSKTLKRNIVENVFIILDEIESLFSFIGSSTIYLENYNEYLNLQADIIDLYEEFINRFYK